MPLELKAGDSESSLSPLTIKFMHEARVQAAARQRDVPPEAPIASDSFTSDQQASIMELQTTFDDRIDECLSRTEALLTEARTALNSQVSQVDPSIIQQASQAPRQESKAPLGHATTNYAALSYAYGPTPRQPTTPQHPNTAYTDTDDSSRVRDTTYNSAAQVDPSHIQLASQAQGQGKTVPIMTNRQKVRTLFDAFQQAGLK